MQPEKLPRDYAERVAAARLLIVGDSITDAVIHFKLANGWDVNDPITDGQCAEFVAFVAEHIGFDIGDSVGGEQRVRQLRDAYDAADGSTSPAD